MLDHRPLVELVQGLGLVWLALGLRLGLVGLAQGVWRQGLVLSLLLLALTLLGVGLLTRPAPGPPTSRPHRSGLGLSVFPASLREEWGGIWRRPAGAGVNRATRGGPSACGRWAGCCNASRRGCGARL